MHTTLRLTLGFAGVTLAVACSKLKDDFLARRNQQWESSSARQVVSASDLSEALPHGSSSSSGRWVSLFAESYSVYSNAVVAGLLLDHPGLGRGGVTHRALFTAYKHVFYLPAVAEPLLSPDGVAFLRSQTGWGTGESDFAGICIRIAASPRRYRRDGTVVHSVERKGEASFSGEFAVHHYD